MGSETSLLKSLKQQYQNNPNAKPISLPWFLLMFLVLIGLFLVSFSASNTLSFFSSDISSSMGWIIGMIVVSIIGAIAFFSLEIYTLYKFILSYITGNFWIQFFISLFLGQIVSFLLGHFLIEKQQIKMKDIQKFFFFIFLLIWLGLAVGMILNANINLDNIIVQFQTFLDNKLSSLSSLNFDNLGETGEQVSGGQINASSIDSWITPIIDFVLIAFANLQKVKDVGGSAGLI